MNKKAILLAILPLLMFNIAFAQNWLFGWQYRVPITITENSGIDLFNYTLPITVNTSALISKGKMKTDCGDMRFTDKDGNTTLSYWFAKETCNTSYTRIWVKIPFIPANNTTTIYMYYGNIFANSMSNGDEVFYFYDDFEDSALNTTKWLVSEGTSGDRVEVENGKLIVYSDGIAPVKTVALQGQIPAHDVAYELEFRVVNVNPGHNIGFGFVTDIHPEALGYFLFFGGDNQVDYYTSNICYYWYWPYRCWILAYDNLYQYTFNKSYTLRFFSIFPRNREYIAIPYDLIYYIDDNRILYIQFNFLAYLNRFVFPRLWNEMIGDIGEINIEWFVVRRAIYPEPSYSFGEEEQRFFIYFGDVPSGFSILVRGLGPLVIGAGVLVSILSLLFGGITKPEDLIKIFIMISVLVVVATILVSML